ncbi:hypothetical protein [Puniceicoccus vermicola]|uniref:Flagellar assembly protein T C-terminal domain-containing protein n=1 Tax=Puniceicoccus vermicola TaxID=388746 RepID=A0A7X1B0B3_9BACT|nr:hypothetical protein [Puniceicoccus vermicola]MBC2603278.1 hypothetical protein [Puniceicoccus vermicola]
MHLLSSIRALVALPLFAAVAVAVPADKPSRPGFVDSLEPSNRAQIARVVVGSEADLVVLSSGWLEGFRTGMACIVSEGNVRTGEILLVDVRLNHAVGLILNRPDDAGINAGNLVTIKTFSVSS